MPYGDPDGYAQDAAMAGATFPFAGRMRQPTLTNEDVPRWLQDPYNQFMAWQGGPVPYPGRLSAMPFSAPNAEDRHSKMYVRALDMPGDWERNLRQLEQEEDPGFWEGAGIAAGTFPGIMWRIAKEAGGLPYRGARSLYNWMTGPGYADAEEQR